MHRIYSSAGGTTIYPIVFNLEWLLNTDCKPGCEQNQVHTLHFLEIWLNSIGYNSDGAPMLLIATHKDKIITPAHYRNLTNFELAQSNDDVKRAHEIVGDFITSLKVYKLGKLNLHMPPQPGALFSLCTLVLIFYLLFCISSHSS